MDAATRRTLRFVASQLVFVAAFLHIGIGLLEWYTWAQAGFLWPGDDRWPAFVASGLLIIAGMYRAADAEDLRPYYLAGIAAMAVYALGYFLWHLIGHPRGWLSGPGPVFEPVGLQWVVDHATAGPEEFVSLAVETIAIVLLVILYLDARRQAVEEPPPEQTEDIQPD